VVRETAVAAILRFRISIAHVASISRSGTVQDGLINHYHIFAAG